MQTLFRTREAMRGFGKNCLKIAKKSAQHIAHCWALCYNQYAECLKDEPLDALKLCISHDLCGLAV